MQDIINHPDHYTTGNIECIDAIKASNGDGFKGYLKGNVIKYIWRYEHKNGVEDLKKARWYLEKLIGEVGIEDIDNATTINSASEQWVSVKDRLPEQDIDDSSCDCLIAIKYKDDKQGEHPSLCSGYLLDNEWWSYGDHDCHKIGDGKLYNGDVVTHWMPLPEPPKEENK